MPNIEKRIARGVSVLDQHTPDWQDKIDTSTLDLASTRRCVLGQVYGDYHTGRDVLTLDGAGWRYGFDVHPCHEDGIDYPDLDAAWTEYLLAWQAEHSAPVPA